MNDGNQEKQGNNKIICGDQSLDKLESNHQSSNYMIKYVHVLS
jgi:hypothetical protein